MRRKVGLFLTCALVLPLAAAAGAHGQGSTLLVDDATPAPGQAITVTGRGYSQPAGTSPISIRLNTRSGPVRADPVPDTLQRISATFPAPQTPGWYLILATQTNTANGRHRGFTPGRTRIRVTTAGPAAAAATGGGRGGLPDSPLGFLAVGSALLLLAAGTTLTVRRIRTLNRPQLDSQVR